MPVCSSSDRRTFLGQEQGFPEAHPQLRRIPQPAPRLVARSCEESRAQHPEEEAAGGGGPAQALVEHRESANHGLLRGMGIRRFTLALPLRQGAKAEEERARLGSLHLDGGQGDGCGVQAPDDFHRRRRHQRQGRAHGREEVRGAQSIRPTLRRSAGEAEGGQLPEGGRAHEAQGLFQPGSNTDRQARTIQGVARLSRADPDSPQVRPELEPDQERREAQDVRQEESAGRPRRLDRRLHAQPLHHSQQLGNRLGKQGIRVRQLRVHEGRLQRGLRHRGLAARPATRPHDRATRGAA